MFKVANQNQIVDIYLPLPDFMRPTDLERLLRAFRSRGVLKGELNPSLNKESSETFDQFCLRFRKLQNPTHLLTDFRLTEKGIKANILFTDPSLVAFEGELKVTRRTFNDYWRLGDQNKDAPGFFGFDIFIKNRG